MTTREKNELKKLQRKKEVHRQYENQCRRYLLDIQSDGGYLP